jgi:hypothetical protein
LNLWRTRSTRAKTGTQCDLLPSRRVRAQGRGMAAHYNKRRTGKRPALVYFQVPYREGVIPQLQMTASAPTLSFTEALTRESRKKRTAQEASS